MFLSLFPAPAVYSVQYIYALLSFSDYLQGDLTKYIYTVTPTLYNFEHQNKIPGKNFFKKIFYMSIRWKYSKRKKRLEKGNKKQT